jgi:hypothetical protein
MPCTERALSCFERSIRYSHDTAREGSQYFREPISRKVCPVCHASVSISHSKNCVVLWDVPCGGPIALEANQRRSHATARVLRISLEIRSIRGATWGWASSPQVASPMLRISREIRSTGPGVGGHWRESPCSFAPPILLPHFTRMKVQIRPFLWDILMFICLYCVSACHFLPSLTSMD